MDFVRCASGSRGVHRPSASCNLRSASAVIAHHASNSRGVYFFTLGASHVAPAPAVHAARASGVEYMSPAPAVCFCRPSAGNLCCTSACREGLVAAPAVYTAPAAVVKCIFPIASLEICRISGAGGVFCARAPC